jgi:ATP/maltotriose-dependent transcriptional regulator MalT
VRQYAQEKLGESGEADEVRTRHRDHYAAKAAEMESRGHSYDEQLLDWAQAEIDNLRAAFVWSRENSELETALRLIMSLRPLWLRGGRIQEALVGLDAILNDERDSLVAPAVWAGAVAQQSILAAFIGVDTELVRGQEALAMARQLDDTTLMAQTLIACGMGAVYSAEVAQPYFAEAIELVRATDDRWSLCQIFSYQATVAVMAGEPIAARIAAEEGLHLADALGDRFFSRNNRSWLGLALMMQGDLAEAERVSQSLVQEAETAGDMVMEVFGCLVHGVVLARQGRAAAATTAAQAALAAAEGLGGVFEDTVYAILADAALAGGDAAAARQLCETASTYTNPLREMFHKSVTPMAEAALACGDLATARRWADDTVAVVPGWQEAVALTTRAYVALAQGEPEQAERDAHESLTLTARTQGYLRTDDTLECLARLAAAEGNYQYAARLLGAADKIRQRMGHARLPMYQPGYDTVVSSVRDALENNDFDAAWSEGTALSTEEAVAYAQRGRGERKRPASGWASLTPTELDVVGLVREGLGNKDIGARLFISPRTVQTHLTHVYAKLGIASRLQLVQHADRRT